MRGTGLIADGCQDIGKVEHRRFKHHGRGIEPLLGHLAVDRLTQALAGTANLGGVFMRRLQRSIAGAHPRQRDP